MAFTYKKQVFSAKLHEVALGTGARRMVIGGESTLPFYTFDAPMPNAPKIAVEIRDTGMAGETTPGMLSFYKGCVTAVDMAKRARHMPGASAVCLSFESADPNGANTPVSDCVKLAKEVADAIDCPLMIMGCKSIEKDVELFAEIAKVLPDKNLLLLSAREENYKELAASEELKNGHTLGAESSVDINLAKQLNVLLSQAGVALPTICMNIGSAAAGYGFEYLSSTMDRIRLAALAQNDAQLQMPIVTPVSVETWAVKEATASEEEVPEWGSREERGIEMEIATASACLVSGADAVILRHPVAVAAIAKFIESLM